jgi:N-acetylglucosamine kinase-like BadF-type ATPase
MTAYYLGVDMGGSKSHALIADKCGHARGFSEAGPGNYEVVGWDGLRHTLHAITNQALASAGIGRDQIVGAGFGVGGYDWPAEEAPTRQAIESLALDAPYALVNDSILGLLAGTAEGWGIVVISGTSNNCRGWDRQGREGRVTGCGSVYGEYGGAVELVARAVQAMALAWTQRGQPTRLTGAFVKAAGATGEVDLLEGLYLGRYSLGPAAAPLVFRVAAEGDPVAQETIRWAGRELASLAIGVIRQLELVVSAFDVVLAGSLYDGGPLLIDAMRDRIQSVAPGARLVRLTAPPVVGGVLLAMEQTGLETSAVREALLASTDSLLRLHDRKRPVEA